MDVMRVRVETLVMVVYETDTISYFVSLDILNLCCAEDERQAKRL